MSSGGAPPRLGRSDSERSADGGAPPAQPDSTPAVPEAADATAASVAASRVGRLLLQRLRKSQSTTVLYGEPEGAVEQLSLQDGGAGIFPQLESGSQRLIVVANRLPVSAYKDRSGRWQLQVSAGGLVSALMGVGNFQTKWIGWPGVYIEAGPERDELTAALHSEGYSPVYLDQKTCDLHYNGFCNSVLWQLFHYVPLNIDSKLSETRMLQFQWGAHQLANKIFAEVVLQHYQDGDIVWVQDYHLMLLPAILKEHKPRMKVGFFLHTPFPSSEIYRTLPVREELLRSVLKADLIGFHTYDYARHFVSACTRILGLEGTPSGVEDNGSLTRVAAFPIGIDPDRFTEALEMPEVKANIAQLLNRYAGRKVMLGVDRLDMIKGIPQKLLAFEKFLEEHPEWRDKVLLVQIAVPSRTDVPEYQRLRSMVHEVVGRINGQYGTLTHVPIYHLDRQLSFNELVALYAITDVALVTSLRDGMNLVSYEYVACQRDNAGVLILSEFAGAAQSLGAGAILVNPWNINDLSQAIEYALMMNDHERRERHRQNYMHVTIHTAQTWADTFISELNDTHVEAELRTKNIPPALDLEAVVGCYKRSRRRLLVLGYNATLTTAVEAPRQPKKHFDQIQALTRVNPAAYSCLAALSQNPRVDVVVISGGEKQRLIEVFGDLHIWLAAENGAVVRPPGSQDWQTLMDAGSGDWKESVQLVFEYFCERTPRSFVEQRGTSLVWNYKYADVEFGRIQARDLLQHLLTGPISNAPVDIVRGSKSVEVRPVGVSKGASMERILQYMAASGASGGPGAGLPSTDFVFVGGHFLPSTDFVFVGGHFLARDENVFTLFEGQEPGAGGSGAAGSPQADTLLSTLFAQDLEEMPTAITPGRTRSLSSSSPNLAALPEGQPAPPVALALAAATAAAQQQAAAVQQQVQQQQAAVQQQVQQQQAQQQQQHFGRRAGLPDNGRQQTGASALPPLPPPGRNGGGQQQQADGLPFKVPPKYLFTCTVGRSMASKASYSLSGSMEVAQLLHKMALADGIPTSQLHLPGMSTSASFDDLLQSLMMAEGSMSTSL
ncbi:Alpha,alpha-trehalose-phosphate synthase [UDP-forming] 1 isoform B [Chlorella sorokiniana]|uniref:alpha,alpha-trehalose-phosphate synthase (UDP-forming) n=1 Tax=Chlorella sorokiniana TaxID=3076 RepID=A0A2P6U3Z8_CHLSO|nr:Alpha,alpha-trehalose-phosphate synthase [UDP-forming] 1 isoform B [Chlorella sorokiniana]|eukprot:PRW61035.1 Alpha,alpha-trehalose-phosphate synthase [UDP-forming] 1 isoform B [Chlorella sorokiniana]